MNFGKCEKIFRFSHEPNYVILVLKCNRIEKSVPTTWDTGILE
jgi:hypothetical protein